MLYVRFDVLLDPTDDEFHNIAALSISSDWSHSVCLSALSAVTHGTLYLSDMQNCIYITDVTRV